MDNYFGDQCFKYLNFRFSDGTSKSTETGGGSSFSLSVTGTINAMESCTGKGGYIKGMKFYVHG